MAGVTTKAATASFANFVIEAIIRVCRDLSSVIKVCARVESPPYCEIRLRMAKTAELLTSESCPYRTTAVTLVSIFPLTNLVTQ